jgi:hypothetical protein
MDEGARLLLMGGVIPLWIAAGLADWWCHRRTRIESTSGLPENLFHWLLAAEGGIAILAAALLEIDAATLLVVFAMFLAHEATTYLELAYTVPRRDVRPLEQMIHSFMELLPLVILALLAAMNWEQVRALLGAGTPDFGLRTKEQPWPAGYLVAAAAAVFLFNLLPMAEETLRCLRERRLRSRTPAPPAPT